MAGFTGTRNPLFKAILSAPILSREEEMALARLAEQGDRAARDKLVMSYGKMVGKIARVNANSQTDFEDMLQDGMLALLEHASHFDPSYNVRFGTYIQFWVKYALREWHHRKGRAVRLPEKVVRNRKIVGRFTAAYEVKHGHAPQATELAKMLRVSEREADLLMQTLGIELIYLSQPHSTFDNIEFGDTLEDSGSLTPEEAAIARDELEVSQRKVLDMLIVLETDPRITDRDRAIFKRYMSQHPNTEVTLGDLGEEHNLSRERVRQIVTRLWRIISGEEAGKKDNPIRREAARIELLQELV